MPLRTNLRRSARALALAAVAALAAVPAASAAPVDLGTAKPFVVLAGNSVTNTGPSVLNGDLGVSPGTSLVGFGFPAVVNGAVHATDGVAANAQADVTEAYNVAAGQPVAPADDLTGQDLGDLNLKPGAYRYASSAQLTGELILDAEGDPDAQFVFEIGSTLTTASASSVLLVGEASPCNVFWQVGSSATIGSTTQFQGNVLALSDISVDSGATIIGRLLAGRDITLIANVLDNADCDALEEVPPPVVPVPTPPPADGGGDTAGPEAPGNGSGASPGSGAPAEDGGQSPATHPASVPLAFPARLGVATLRRTPYQRCTQGFRGVVRGSMIAGVSFTLDGRSIASRPGMPFQVLVRALRGRHTVRARVTFNDGTPATTLTLPYRVCAQKLRRPRVGPSRFTG